MARKRRGNRQGSLFKRTSGGHWIASWHDHKGKRRERSTRTTEKAAADRILRKYVEDAALKRAAWVLASPMSPMLPMKGTTDTDSERGGRPARAD